MEMLKCRYTLPRIQRDSAGERNSTNGFLKCKMTARLNRIRLFIRSNMSRSRITGRFASGIPDRTSIR